MRSPLVQLLTTRRFAPLFVTQFLGAFNDNLLKSAHGHRGDVPAGRAVGARTRPRW